MCVVLTLYLTPRRYTAVGELHCRMAVLEIDRVGMAILCDLLDKYAVPEAIRRKVAII